MCTLESKNEQFSNEFIEKFASLDLDNQYEFEKVNVNQTNPCVVRLYIDGKLFSDASQLDSNNIPNNDQIEASINGTNGEDNNSIITDAATEAKRISQDHFKSIETMGLAIAPANL